MLSHVRSRALLVISFLISLVIHALMITALLYISHLTQLEEPQFTPVKIVDLPQQAIKQLPPIQQPLPGERTLPRPAPDQVPTPRKFGTSDEIRLPKMLPRIGGPTGGEQGKEQGKSTPKKSPNETGPLPFLTQRYIDELARKGMPAKKPGDDSITLDTDEFKFMSYNRWLTIKIESILRYPELAAVSGYHGMVFIRFDIMKDGSLGAIELLKSSGYKILDDEALRSIRDSAPFQPLPAEWDMDRYPIRAVVIFYMNQGYIR
jgi:periplasmic protein TonB